MATNPLVAMIHKNKELHRLILLKVIAVKVLAVKVIAASNL